MTPAAETPAARFQNLRERAGLSHEEAARKMDISTAAVWDLESYDDELATVYSPAQIRRFACVLGVRAAELAGAETSEAPVTVDEVVRMIAEQCECRNVCLEQFEDAVGWRLVSCLEAPERVLEELSIDGLQSLCLELGIDWRRVIAGL